MWISIVYSADNSVLIDTQLYIQYFSRKCSINFAEEKTGDNAPKMKIGLLSFLHSPRHLLQNDV
jgi:hypothetical protein